MKKRSLRNYLFMLTTLAMVCILGTMESHAEEIYKASPSNALFIGVQNEDNKMATGKNITVKSEDGTVIGTWTVGNKPECRDIYQWCFDWGTFKMKEEYFQQFLGEDEFVDVDNEFQEGTRNDKTIKYKDISLCDYVLPAGKYGIWADTGWAQSDCFTDCFFIDDVKCSNKNYLGLNTFDAPVGSTVSASLSNTYFSNDMVISDVEKKYIKRKYKLCEIDSSFDESGRYKHYNRDTESYEYYPITINGDQGDTKRWCNVLFCSGNMVMLPIPDENGYVELYVDADSRSVWREIYAFESKGGSRYSTINSKSYIYNLCEEMQCTFQAMDIPKNGAALCDLPKGTYTIEVGNLSSNEEVVGASYVNGKYSVTTTLVDSDEVQPVYITINKKPEHEHIFSDYNTDETYHWKTCLSSECNLTGDEAKLDFGAHSFDSYNKCTICGYQLIKDESDLTGNQIQDKENLDMLIVKGAQAGKKNAVKIKWAPFEDADGYEIYWCYCDQKRNFKLLKATKNTSYTHKKLRKNRAYRYFVCAYKMVDGKKVYLCKSPTTHVAMNYHKCTNVKSLKTAKKSYDLTVSQTVKLKTTIKKQNKKLKIIDHEPKLRYFTSCKDVAVVDKKGKVTATGQGECIIYVVAHNGITEKVIVKVS